MREAGQIVAEALQKMREAVRPGISTKQLDKIGETVLRDYGATPAFLNYAPGEHPPFPAVITACLNNELVHGIPSEKRILKEGDIVSLDIACFHKGYVGDAAFTMAVGEVPPAVKRLIETCEKALYVAIEASVAGAKVSDVARATERFAARNGYSVAREYTGHGVGKRMHEPPQVPNWWPTGRLLRQMQQHQNGWTDYILKPGMTYAIEPMLIIGRNDLYELDDGWTVVTKDGSLCAHCEHTVLITEGKAQILTLP
jgi:methionyl aminopeptidase